MLKVSPWRNSLEEFMRDYQNNGVNQSIMSSLFSVHPSTLSRFISSNNIRTILEPGKRIRFSIEETRSIANSIYKNNFPIDPRSNRHCFYNFKGGTGKTSICLQVSTHLSLLGYKVLVVDTDPQGHLSTSLGFDSGNNYLTLYDLLVKNRTFDEVIQPVFDGFDCIPSNLSLTRLEASLNDSPKREERMKIKFQLIEHKYDFMIFDTNPSISILNRNVITYCSNLNIVCETQPYSLNGLKILMEDLGDFYEKMQIDLPKITIIPNKYEDRLSSSAEAMTALSKYYKEYLIPDFAIRKSEDFNTAAKNGLPFSMFSKRNSIALEDIVDLVHKITEMCKTSEKIELLSA